MTGVSQLIDDIKVIVSTDKRIWLAATFICTCTFIFLITGSWREVYVEEEPVVWKRMRIPNSTWKDRISKLNEDVQESKREREQLRDRLTRATNTIQSTQKEIDWQVDRLINTLDSMTSKVDSMVNQVGPQLVQQKELELRSAGGKKKKKK